MHASTATLHLQLWWTYPVWQPSMNKGHKDATRDDNARGLLRGYNRRGDKLPAFHNCRRDSEVIHDRRRGAIRLRDNAGKRAGAVTVHSVSSRIRSGGESSCSSC